MKLWNVVFVICLLILAMPVQANIPDRDVVLAEDEEVSVVRKFFSKMADNIDPIAAYDLIGKEGLAGVRLQVASKPGLGSADVGLLGDDISDLALIGGLSADIEGLVHRIGWNFDLPDRAILAGYAGIRLADEENRKGKDRYLAGFYAGWEL